jgi:zinc protease
MINRTQQPDITNSFSLNLMQFNMHELHNGCIIYHFPYEILPVAKVEFIFPVGKKNMIKPLIAHYTGKMILEGTSEMNQQQIAEAFELLGTTVNIEVYEDISRLTVYSTTRNISEALVLIHHILTDSVFPEEQLKILTTNDKQGYLTNLKKVSFMARRQLYISVFTNQHPYTHYASEEDYDKVQRNELVAFFRKYYDLSRAMIVWTGSMEETHLSLTEKLFGTSVNDGIIPAEPDFPIVEERYDRVNIHMEDATQSAIYIGRFFPGINHPDAFDLTILTTILGGYFGSRLMKNLREDKGYTYGISSNISHLEHASLFMIGTQVKAQYTEDAIQEINREITRLQNDDISSEELELVKNYLYGSMLQNIDGPFAQSKLVTQLIRRKIDAHDYLEKFSLSIRQITPKTIKYLTQKYLQFNKLIYSVSGNIQQ